MMQYNSTAFLFFSLSLSVSLCFFQYVHRHTRIPDPFLLGQADELSNNHSANTQPAHRISKKLISSQTTTATTDRPSDRRTGCQQAVRHTTCGALRNSQGLDKEIGKERGGEGEANTEDDPELTGVQQKCHTLQPNKSFTLGNTFAGVCVGYVYVF